MHKMAELEHVTEKPDHFDRLVREGNKGGPGDQWFYNEFRGFDMTGIRWQQPDVLIEADTTIRLGDTEVNILSVAPAHSDSDLLLWLPKEKVVFCGDVVFGGAIAYSAKGMKLCSKALSFI